MGLTLLEAAKSETDQARVAVIRELAEGELLRMLPFRDVDGAGLFYDQEGELPSVGFRGINEKHDDSYGVLNPQAERLKMFGGEIDVDMFKIDTEGPRAKTDQIEMKVRSMRLTYEDKFINGDSAVNPREFDGLKSRINPASSQYIDAGGALSLELLDELIDQVDAAGASPVLLMNRKMRRRLSKASRDTSIGGFIQYSQDEFGKQVTRYGEVPIVTIERNAENAEVMPFTETGNTTSIYCIGMGDLLTTALQGRARGSFGIHVAQMGEVPDAPVDRTRIEWYVGQAIYNGRSAARLAGITDAAVTA